MRGSLPGSRGSVEIAFPPALMRASNVGAGTLMMISLETVEA